MHYDLWNDFITKAKNATFLFHRDFMEYHSERFQDHSLLIYKDDVLVAILPAHTSSGHLYSHLGLTYGGLVLAKQVTLEDILNAFECLMTYIEGQNLKSLLMKGMVKIYHKQDAEELGYALSYFNAKIDHRKIVMAIDYSKPLRLHKSKIKYHRKALGNGLKVVEDDQLDDFWNTILIPRLNEKHKVRPVHSLEEIKRLKKLFPSNIKQFNVYRDKDLLGGITLFEMDNVVKSQYGIASSDGEKERAIDFLFVELIRRFLKEGKSYFSMGTVNDSSAMGFNAGLMKQKQELGCEVYLQDIFKLDIND